MKDQSESGVGEVAAVENRKEIKTLQSNTQIDISTPEGVELQTRRIEKFMEAQKRIRIACIQMTNIHDWVDQDGKPYLQWTGTSKIANAFGVSYDTPKFTQTPTHDDEGDYIDITCESMIRYAGRSVPEMGSCTTRDQFFAQRSREVNGKREKYFLPISELDINDIKKKSLTNMLNRGLKSLLGMSFSWDEISAATNGAITAEKCASVKHSKGSQGGRTDSSPQVSADRGRVWTMILEICGGDEGAAQARLKKMTSFTSKQDGKLVAGKSDIKAVSEAQLTYLAKDVTKEYEAYTKSMGDKAPAEGGTK